MFEQSQLDSLPPEIAAALTNESAIALITAQIEAAKAPLVSKRDEVLGQLTESKKTLKQIEDMGGLSALTELRTKAKQAEDARKAAELDAATKSGDSEALKAHYASQLTAKEQELSNLRESIVQEKVSAKLNAAIREAKGVPELLMPHMKDRLKASMEDGKLKLSVLDDQGFEAPTKSINDLVEEFKANATFGRAFEANSVSGAGSRPSSTPASSNPFNPANANMTEQGRLYNTDKPTAIRMAKEFGIDLE